MWGIFGGGGATRVGELLMKLSAKAAAAALPFGVGAACFGALGLRLRVDGSWGTMPSSTALTTIPPEEPPHEASEPMGVRLALSFLSMMTGWPFSIRIFWPM